MTSAQEIFEATIALMDELSEAGQANTGDTIEYKNRTVPILNILRGELYPYSDNYGETEEGKRPIAVKIQSIADIVQLDDYICQSVMPYGLAAHLLLAEDPSAASFFQQKYEELKMSLARGMPKESEDISDVYGGCFEHREYGWW